MRVPYLLSLGYEGEERIAKNMRRYVIETTSYTLSTAISTDLVNALAMRYLGYGIVEMGALALLRTAAVSVGSVAALPLLERYRRERLRVRLLFGTVNRVGWAPAPLLPPPLNHATLLGVVPSAQLAGAIAGVASMDALADNVRPSVAGSMFSTAPIPVLYASSESLTALVGVNVYASIAWTPWEIANTLYTVYLAPESKRPSFVSAQNVAFNAVAAIGTGFGALIASISGVTSAFVISSLLRAAVALLSLRWMPELER